MKKLLPFGIVLLLSFYSASGQIFHVQQMNADRIRALDKQRTVTSDRAKAAGLAETQRYRIITL